jgi:hypothetical protein
MKVSYKNKPIIKELEKALNRKMFDLDVYEEDRIEYLYLHLKNIQRFVIQNIDVAMKNVSILTEPFISAYLKSSKKIEEVLFNDNKPQKEIINEQGVLCYKNVVWFYSLSSKGDGLFDGKFLHFNGKVLMCFVNDDVNNSFITKDLLIPYGMNKENGLDGYNQDLIQILWFIKHCDIEIKELGAKKKLKDINCKYINDTDSNIKILDSTWFTTLIKKDSFNVRGHFRLQACGVDRQERKLIWISEFEKDGYTRHFKRPVNID